MRRGLIPNPCDGEAAFARFFHRDVDALPDETKKAEAWLLRGELARLILEPEADRVLWINSNGEQITATAWLRKRLALLSAVDRPAARS